MSESKHTLGPWEIAEGDKEGQLVIQETTTGMGLRIAFLGNLGPERTQANAELLARAPDLLREVEELREARDEMERLYDSESSLREYAQEFGSKMENEVESLRAQNAELLEALERLLRHEQNLAADGWDRDWTPEDEQAIRDTIAKAKGGAD